MTDQLNIQIREEDRRSRVENDKFISLQGKIKRISTMTGKTFSQIIPLHQKSELVNTPDNEKWLLSRIQNPVVAALLIYKGSRDGWSKRKFHELCNRMGPTLTIIKTKAGAICGGFTMQDWTSNSGYKSDRCAFVFRLDTKLTYSP